jgi:hypothetical protein
MTRKISCIIAAAAIIALPYTLTGAGAAETVETMTQQAPPPPGKRIINLREFDLNKDGMMSAYEVGEMLFKVFDTNLSGALEPAEYESKSLVTVVPMEKETTISYDFNNDGIADAEQTTMQTFMQETQLARFDDFKDGMSPHEFVAMSFADADADRDGGIDIDEWRTAYMTRIAPALVAPAAGP